MAYRYGVKSVGLWGATVYFSTGKRSLAPPTLTVFTSLFYIVSVLNEANPYGMVSGHKLNKKTVGTLLMSHLTERELSLSAPFKDLEKGLNEYSFLILLKRTDTISKEMSLRPMAKLVMANILNNNCESL